MRNKINEAAFGFPPGALFCVGLAPPRPFGHACNIHCAIKSTKQRLGSLPGRSFAQPRNGNIDAMIVPGGEREGVGLAPPRPEV